MIGGRIDPSSCLGTCWVDNMAVWWFHATCFHGLKYLCVNREVLKQNFCRPYFSMLGAVADIQSKFDFYMDQIENSGDMDAAQALFLTFVRNYCRIIERFNRKFEEFPNFNLH